MRQLSDGVAPENVTAVSPRAALCASLAPPSSLCAIGRTSTDSTWAPLPRRLEGMVKVAVAVQVLCVACDDVGTGCRCAPSGVPSSQAISRPWVPEEYDRF